MSEIDDKYIQLGAGGSFLGHPLIAEGPAPDNIGRFRHYEGGSIYWSPQTGAHEAHGGIKQKWSELGWERDFLGYPLTDETATPDGIGRFNHFQGGSIYWSPATGAHELHGGILEKWAQLGWERSPLGYPLTDEGGTPDGGGRFNHFEWGSIYWTPALGGHEVRGFIRLRWAELGWERGALGYPISDEHDTPHGKARASDFVHGSIYWDQGRGAYEVFPQPPPANLPPNTHGRWDMPPVNAGVVGVHFALLHTNKVLFFSYRDPGPEADEEPQEHGDSAVLDLSTFAVSTPQLGQGERNLFCSGHAFLADGRLLITGGERQSSGLRSLHTFDPNGPNGGTWTYLRDMATGRWYPTPATLPDGRVFILGGVNLTEAQSDANVNYEIFDPTAGPQPLQASDLLMEVGPFVTFPFVFVLPNRKLFMHAGTRTRFLDLTNWNHDPVAFEAAARPDRNCRTYNLQGTAVLLPLKPGASPPYRARIMMFGGGGAAGANMRTPATNTCEIMDTGAPALQWELAAPMAKARVMCDAVLLPDGKVLVVNGSNTGFADNGANPVYDAEIYSPDTNTWSQMARMTVPRLYHSTALLLPDGRVMTAGSDSMWNPDPFHDPQLRLEIFSPPYLFAGPRPALTDAPDQVAYGADFEVQTPDAAMINEACLLRCGSATHSFNPDQRYVGAEIVSRGAGTLTLRAPPDGFVAPPGYYMLFVLRNGVPSVSRFVRLGQ